MVTSAESSRSVVVRALELEADGVLSVGLATPDGSPFPLWRAGAHIDVVTPDGSVRQYSLSGRPEERDRLRITVLHEPAGRGGSAWLHERVRPGDEVVIRGPRNHFALAEDAPGVLFVAGGIGITPLLPMLDEADARGLDWTLAYFGRTRNAMAFLADLERRPERAARVRVLARDEHHGVDLPALIGAAPSDHLVHVCGPERMIAEATELLTARGEEHRLRVEYFAAPEVEAAEPGSFTVRLDRSDRELHVPADVSLLRVLDDAGADVLSDCAEGICGSCETKVLAGEIDHRDFVLTSTERAAQNCMMVCVSRSTGGRLVLDL